MPEYSSDYGEDNSSHIDRFSSEIPSSPHNTTLTPTLLDSNTIQVSSNYIDSELSQEDYSFSQEVKARAIIDRSITFNPLIRHDPNRLVRIQLPDSFYQNYSPMAFFELFFSPYIIDILCQNTNQYAIWMEAGKALGSRYWYPVTPDEVRVFLACSIYMGICVIQDTRTYWRMEHFPMRYISLYRFKQIKRYFHICPPGPPNLTTKRNWFEKVNPLLLYLKDTFKKYIQPPTNIAIDEMIAAYSGMFLIY